MHYMQNATKSCESDVIPTSLQKEILLALEPSLAKIFNISLEHGIFASQWKVAIIRPLLKKVGLDLISSNLAGQQFSVSLPKFWERWCWNNSQLTVTPTN